MATPTIIGLAALALTSVSVATPASAGAASKDVSYADLNLASKAGQKSLHKRIKAAARSVCASRQATTLEEHRDVRNCMKGAMSSAMPKAEAAITQYKTNARFASGKLPVAGN